MILDASAIVKLLLEESGSDLAEACVERSLEAGEEVASVDIALAEALNALWKHAAVVRDLDEGGFREAASELLSFWERLEVISTRELAPDAVKLALEEGITVHDALYLAAAARRMTKLATFDERLREAARRRSIPVCP